MARTTFSTALGDCAIAWRDENVTGFELTVAGMRATDEVPPPAIALLIERVRRHLSGEFQDFADVRFAFDLVPAFQADVLRAALDVKAGQTRSYGEIAAALGQPPAASRAVGSALGANPWPLLVPCHRIVSAEGKMTGFSGPGGIKTKLRLLALEGAQLFAE